MKKSNYMKTIAYCLCLLLLCSACKEDNLSSEAEMLYSFTVKNEEGEEYKGVIGDDNTITIKVSPYLDAAVELAEATPSFYISRGATVAPDPALPQNFAQAGGVKYTITAEDGSTKREYTVTWSVSDKMPYGDGFSHAEVGAQKNFGALGYPTGTLNLYHAYCGNYIVLLSRVYITANPTSPHCVKVVDKTTLDPAGTLNLGSISLANLRMITSDYKGRCVGMVVTGSNTEFFYWTTPTAAPVSVGSIGVNMAPATDGSNNFQVAGDITGNAWITALAPRSATGDHYRIKVTGGQLALIDYTVSTGHASDDCSGFQMISPLNDSDEPDFVVGDTEGTPGSNNTTPCYINSYAGAGKVTLRTNPWSIMPPDGWWVGSGVSTQQTGGRVPLVLGMLINGKSYVAMAGGSAWFHGVMVLNTDLATLAHKDPLLASSSIFFGRNDAFGCWADWYWNEEEDEAYLAVWFDLIGELFTYKLTCFE
jgi:hypothetical protein